MSKYLYSLTIIIMFIITGASLGGAISLVDAAQNSAASWKAEAIYQGQKRFEAESKSNCPEVVGTKKPKLTEI